MKNLCPPVQSVSDVYLANILALIERDDLTSGPMAVWDKDRLVFLVAVFEKGVMQSWNMTSCPTAEDAEREVVRVKIIAEALATCHADLEKNIPLLAAPAWPTCQ